MLKNARIGENSKNLSQIFDFLKNFRPKFGPDNSADSCGFDFFVLSCSELKTLSDM